MWVELGMAATAGAALFLLAGGKNERPPRTAQEFVSYKSLSRDGIIELPGQRFRLVLEVQPINLALKSPEEKQAIWAGFRQMLDSLTLKVSFLVQTRYLDMREYLHQLEQAAAAAATPELMEYGAYLIRDLALRSDRNVRDRRYYVIVKYDQDDSYDLGIETNNQAVNSALARVTRKAVSDATAREMARQELENTATVIQASLANLGIFSVRLDRAGVLEMLYATFNRDMAPVMRVADADAQEMFSLVQQSSTPFMKEPFPEEAMNSA